MAEAKRIRVLLVEDQHMFAQSLMRVLEDVSDVEIVAVATTAEEALRAAREHAPDVVLMDYNLPDSDGAKATEKIKAERPDAKVVMLTAYEDEEVLVAAIEAGCSDFVTKSRAVDDAVNSVRAAAAGENLISPDMLSRLLPRLGRSHRGLGSDLTPREIQVLALLGEGVSTKQVAERLYVSVNTVRNHVQNILAKLDAHSKLEAVATAVREGIISFPR